MFDVPQRNAVTWQDDDAFIFHYIGVGEDSSSPASNKSLSFDDDDEIVYENRTDSPETETTATVSVEPRPLTFSPLLDAAHDTVCPVIIIDIIVIPWLVIAGMANLLEFITQPQVL